MPIREFRCSKCGSVRLLFPEEGERKQKASLLGPCDGRGHEYQEQEVQPAVVHSTEQFMVEGGYLDSLGSIYELDRQLNIEAREAKELAVLEKVRKDI